MLAYIYVYSSCPVTVIIYLIEKEQFAENLRETGRVSCIFYTLPLYFREIRSLIFWRAQQVHWLLRFSYVIDTQYFFILRTGEMAFTAENELSLERLSEIISYQRLSLCGSKKKKKFKLRSMLSISDIMKKSTSVNNMRQLNTWNTSYSCLCSCRQVLFFSFRPN